MSILATQDDQQEQRPITVEQVDSGKAFQGMLNRESIFSGQSTEGHTENTSDTKSISDRHSNFQRLFGVQSVFGNIDNFKNFDDFSYRPSQVTGKINQKFEEEKV